MPVRHFSAIDQGIAQIDKALRLLTTRPPANRAYPASHLSEAELTPLEKNHAASLMRVNHAGEISAQGLYKGQALTAKDPQVRAKMEQCASEEIDHLNWCEQRLDELGSQASRLNGIWYFGSFLIGSLAGLAGDKWSLGFIEETEQQVMQHLDSHKRQLPSHDIKTAAVIDQIHRDEAHHAQTARQLGARPLPKPIQWLMRVTAKIMTVTAYRV